MGSDDEDELAELRAARAARTGQTTLVKKRPVLLLLLCNPFLAAAARRAPIKCRKCFAVGSKT
jgi:hypothetical protein